jgi:hypothetical protein
VSNAIKNKMEVEKTESRNRPLREGRKRIVVHSKGSKEKDVSVERDMRHAAREKRQSDLLMEEGGKGEKQSGRHGKENGGNGRKGESRKRDREYDEDGDHDNHPIKKISPNKNVNFSSSPQPMDITSDMEEDAIMEMVRNTTEVTFKMGEGHEAEVKKFTGRLYRLLFKK